MMIDGLLGIQKGQNPRIIRDLLLTYLPGSKRLVEDNTKEAEAAAK